MTTHLRNSLGWSVALGLLLAACSQPVTPPPSGAEPRPWTYKAEAGGQKRLTLAAGSISLVDGPLLSARNGSGPFERNRSNGSSTEGDGAALTVNGVRSATGLGVHAHSELNYALQSTTQLGCTFSASVGVDDEVGDDGSVVVQVAVDGVPRYTSPVLTGRSPARNVSVRLDQASTLTLSVTDAGDGADHDHADWLNPVIRCTETVAATAGRPDPTFQTGGFGRPASVTALQPDGRILGFGVEPAPPDEQPQKFFVARLLPDGKPDASFKAPALSFSAANTALSVAVQPDGDVLLLGRASLPRSPLPDLSNDNFLFLQRLLPGGQPDPSFGNGADAGYPGTLFLEWPGDARALTVQPDSRVLIGGSQGSAFVVRALLPDGQPDASFGVEGERVLDLGPAARLETLTTLPDGRFLAAGRSGDQGGQPTVVRFTASGAPDPTFGAAGVTRLDDPAATVHAALLRPGGQALLAGTVQVGAAQVCALWQLTPDGAPDSTFHASPDLTVTAPADQPTSLALQADGRSIMGGCAMNAAPALFRFLDNGTADFSYGGPAGAAVQDSRSVLLQPGRGAVSGLTQLSRLLP
ncbi:NPCBM/NEW2 domain-containing protein [Deinococcus sonorensis]|uniref:NPCBM/NEW2 domain-containing protein n=2 Tax=Deinococcus sonorensis TaxID=309891 RepID=A0AAU7U8V5_9DEIO